MKHLFKLFPLVGISLLIYHVLLEVEAKTLVMMVENSISLLAKIRDSWLKVLKKEIIII